LFTDNINDVLLSGVKILYEDGAVSPIGTFSRSIKEALMDGSTFLKRCGIYYEYKTAAVT